MYMYVCPSGCSGVALAVPSVRCEEVEVGGQEAWDPISEATPTRLSWFLLGTLRVAAATEHQLLAQPHPQTGSRDLLPQLIGNTLLILQSLVTG